MALAIKENRPVRNVQALAERPDGTFVRFAPLPTPIQDTSGRLVSAVNVLLDVSAQSLLQANLHTPAENDLLRSSVGVLTRRERDVLEGIVAGQSNKVIARGLGISPRTVEVHRRTLMSKLKAQSVADLVRLAMTSHQA